MYDCIAKDQLWISSAGNDCRAKERVFFFSAGMTLEQAHQQLTQDLNAFGTTMVKAGDASGMVPGSITPPQTPCDQPCSSSR